jgi:hypothetical protein
VKASSPIAVELVTCNNCQVYPDIHQEDLGFCQEGGRWAYGALVETGSKALSQTGFIEILANHNNLVCPLFLWCPLELIAGWIEIP